MMRTKLDSSTPHLGGDGGGLLFFAFILAMILMFLASCKSKQVTINEQVDSVSVSTFSLADIRSQMLDFSFDSMEIVVVDTPRMWLIDRLDRRFPEECGLSIGLSDAWSECVKNVASATIVKIKGGRMRAESLESRAERSEKRDSVKVKSEYHEEKITKPPIMKWGSVIIILAILFFIATIRYQYRK